LSFLQVASSWFDQLPENERSKVKGLLAFPRCIPQHFNMLYSLCENAGSKPVALCGGPSRAVGRRLDDELRSHRISSGVVFFCGEEHLNVSSFFLGESVRGQQAVQEAMGQVRFKMETPYFFLST
jgi:hypothetical protein